MFSNECLSPFRDEKNTNWEGGYRVPMFVRWPAKIKAGGVVNDSTSALDWVPTLMAAAGNHGVKKELKQGQTFGDKKYKVYLDGYNLLPNLTGEAVKDADWPRRVPKIFNLRTDPFERADTDANNYKTWWIRRVFALVPAQTFVKEYIDTFKEFPPRQKPARFNVDDALSTLKSTADS